MSSVDEQEEVKTLTLFHTMSWP